MTGAGVGIADNVCGGDAGSVELQEPVWEEAGRDEQPGELEDLEDLADLDLDVLLPPPVVELREEGFGQLHPELWRKVAFFLDPVAICQADAVSYGARHTPQFEAELWACLCSQHFPTMYSSVLSDHGLAQAKASGCSSPSASSSTPQGKCKGKRGSNKSGGRPTGPRTPWWRRSSNGSRGSFDSTTASSLALDEDDELIALRMLSPEASPVLEPTSPSLGAASPDLGPDFDLVFLLPETPLPRSGMQSSSSPGTPSSPPLESPLCPSPASPDASIGQLADWRSLYAKRFKKKVQWDAAKSTAAEPQTRRFSELSRRELGKLSDAAHRLKVCTLCGEKYSPGEARKDATSCCHHQGGFGPADAQGWSQQDLKRLQQFARHALKNAGGASWVQRNPRASKGHGHWLKGLGMFSKDKLKFRNVLVGEVPGTWSCCGAAGLFAEGCQLGPHRHF